MNKYKQEMKTKLEDIDFLLRESNMTLEIVIVGGAAFILKGLVPRATFDIDFINKTNMKAINMLEAAGFDINSRVETYIYQYGYSWDLDLEELFSTESLVVKTLSTERLMISKLFANKRHEDFESSIQTSDITKEKFEEVFVDTYSVAYEMSSRRFKENAYMVKYLYKEKGWDYETSDIKDLCER